MIHNCFTFLASELNAFLPGKLQDFHGTIFLPGNPYISGNNAIPDGNHGFLTLVTIQGDSAFRNQPGFTIKPDRAASQLFPLNVHLLISISHSSYIEALNWLSETVNFFQAQPVFTNASHALPDPAFQKIIVEFQSMSLDDASNVSSILGGPLLPCALFKLKMTS